MLRDETLHLLLPRSLCHPTFQDSVDEPDWIKAPSSSENLVPLHHRSPSFRAQFQSGLKLEDVALFLQCRQHPLNGVHGFCDSAALNGKGMILSL